MAAAEAIFRQMTSSALLLALFAVAGTGLVAFVHEATFDRIQAAEKERLAETLHQIVPAGEHDNDLAVDTIKVRDPLLGTSKPVTVYRARKEGRPAAVVMNAVAPDGYSGDIELLVGIRSDGTVTGVRVTSHHETPGLGDKIEAQRSDWIKRFTGRSLHDPEAGRWKVKKDGGVFDQFTGATITPRAVVKAVYNAQRYFAAHRDQLFAAPAQEAPHG